MQIFRDCACLALLACLAWAQQPADTTKTTIKRETSHDKIKALLESNIKNEWEAFKNKDKKSYSDLLADDFAAVEDDNQGMRTKAAAVAEVDQSVVSNYHLFGLRVISLDANSTLVIYELTLEFPPKAVVRFKRVLVSEIWLKRNGQWKERYYQETHAR